MRVLKEGALYLGRAPESALWIGCFALLLALLVAERFAKRLGRHRLANGTRFGMELWLLAGVMKVGVWLAIISLLIPAGFVLLMPRDRTCEEPLAREEALRVARDYYLNRPMVRLDSGNEWEKNVARKLREAGFAEAMYLELVKHAEPMRIRRVGDKSCGLPLLHYDQRESLNYEGYDIDFVRYVPGRETEDWQELGFGLTIGPCGQVYHEQTAFRGTVEHAFAIRMGFSPCP